MAPSKSYLDGDELVIEWAKYKTLVKDLRKNYWQLVFKLKGTRDVDRMDSDTFCEAVAAMQVLAEDEKAAFEEAKANAT